MGVEHGYDFELESLGPSIAIRRLYYDLLADAREHEMRMALGQKRRYTWRTPDHRPWPRRTDGRGLDTFSVAVGGAYALRAIMPELPEPDPVAIREAAWTEAAARYTQEVMEGGNDVEAAADGG